MPNLNRCMFMGNLTRDPEVKYTPKGTAIASFGIAINRIWTGDNGEKKEEVTFLNLESYGKIAETIGEYCKKGRPLYVECHAKVDQWDDKQTGQKRSAVKFVVDSFQFLGGKREEDDGGGQEEQRGYAKDYKAPAKPPAQRPKPPYDPDLDAAPDDIPF